MNVITVKYAFSQLKKVSLTV